MSTDKKGGPSHANDGWSPGKKPLHEGYQPSQDKKPGTSKEEGGYQPISKGDNPGNKPSTPPGEE
jgi:hypothetical protein